MALIYERLPLFTIPYYSYTSPLNNDTYELTFLYNNRMQKWILDVSRVGGERLVSGIVLSPEFPILFDYTIGFPGIFYLEPIGLKRNETINNPYEIYKYYKLYFVYDNGEE